MSFDDIYRRMLARGEVKPKMVKTSLPNDAPSAFAFDLQGLIQNMIDDSAARALHGLPKPAGERPLPARVDALFRRMEKAIRGVPAPVPSHVDQPAATSVPAPAPSYVDPPAHGRKSQVGDTYRMSILNRHAGSGRIDRVRFDGPAGVAYVGVVAQRDLNQRVEVVDFQRVA